MKKACPICGYEDNQAGQQETCALCGADFGGDERKLLEAPKRGSYATADKLSAIRMEASVYLTDRRILVVPLKLQGYGLQGILTAAVYNKMTSKNGVISAPLSCVTGIRDGRFGLVKALILDLNDGGLLKITVPAREEWKAAITRQLQEVRV
jgi:hypothetical protein